MLARRALDSLAALGGGTNLVLASPPAIASLLAPEFPGATWLPTRGHGFVEARQLGLAFHQARIERLILFPDSFSSRVTAFYSEARERIGHGPRGWDLEAALALTRSVPRRRRGERHLEEEYLDLARAAGGDVQTPRCLIVTPEAQASADTLLAGVTKPLILAPGARYGPAKRWAPERFAEVARAWRGQVVLVGDEGDAGETSAVRSHLDKSALDLTGKTDLPTLAAVLARAAAVVSNDSGAAHVAAALGRPTIIVFGSTDPSWTAPRGDHVTVIRDPVRCSPCFRSVCPLEDAYACLRIVESDGVIRALPQ
jgi:heptosyltransferase-2